MSVSVPLAPPAPHPRRAHPSLTLPRHLSGAKLAALLRRYGYEQTRQSGSHMRLTTTSQGSEHHITSIAAYKLVSIVAVGGRGSGRSRTGARCPAGSRTRGHIERVGEAAPAGAGIGSAHSSQVKGSSLRELRPRQGRSPWRAFYRRRWRTSGRRVHRTRGAEEPVELRPRRQSSRGTDHGVRAN